MHGVGVGGGGGGSWLPPPSEILPSFFLDDNTSAADVFSSFSFIPRAHFKTSSVMASFYGYEISPNKWQAGQVILEWKCMFFNFFQQNLKSCEVLIYVLFFMSSTKKFLFLAILTWFLILGIIQDAAKKATIVGDVTGLYYLPWPIKYTSSCWEDQRLSTEGQIVSKYCNISKTRGGGGVGPSNPLPPFTTVGVWILRVRPRVKYTIFELFKVVVVEFLST